MFEAAAISFRRRPAGTGLTPATSDDAGEPAGRAPEHVADDPEQPGTEPEQPAARRRAERIWQQHHDAGNPLTGTQLARLAGISPRYSRTLLAEFRAQPDSPPAHANGRPPAAAERLDQTRSGRHDP